MWIVRAASVHDAEVLAHHRASMFRDMGAVDTASEESLRRASAAYFVEAIPSGEYFGWLAISPGERATVVGGAGVQLRRMLPQPWTRGIIHGPEGLVLNVYTEPGWRRRGVALRLMRELLTWAHDRRLDYLVLHASPAGRSLYERLGFVATNEMRLVGDRAPSTESGAE
jgi:GNAT superfamily N-acetyltransferase